MQEKTCTRCKQCLPVANFRTRQRYDKAGLVSMCRKCETAYMAARYKQKGDGRLIYIPDPLNIAAREWGCVDRTGQLRPIVKVELEKVA